MQCVMHLHNSVTAFFVRKESVEEGNMKQEKTGTRINRFLSLAGICARREADRALEAGDVRIGKKIALVGERVQQGDVVYFRGKRVRRGGERILIAFHKPLGVVCTTSKKEQDNIVDYISYAKRIYPVGRLDKDSTGLILLTNDGDIVNKIMRAGNRHEKEYVVSINKEVTEDFVMQMSNGVSILNTLTRPCKVWKSGIREFHIILTQGMNRQIRRMCKALGYEVRSLKRIRIMNIHLGDLKEGEYRNLTKKEWKKLDEMLRNSSSETVRW